MDCLINHWKLRVFLKKKKLNIFAKQLMARGLRVITL